MLSDPGSVSRFGAAICAKFFANRSLSLLSSFCFLFMAPGRDFMLFLLMILTCSAGFDPAALLVFAEPDPPSVSSPSSSGRASTSASRFATSFLLGLRRRGFEGDDLVTLDCNCARLIWRLSFLEVAKSGSGRELVVDFASLRLSIDLGGVAVLAGSGRRRAMMESLDAHERKLKDTQTSFQPVSSTYVFAFLVLSSFLPMLT